MYRRTVKIVIAILLLWLSLLPQTGSAANPHPRLLAGKEQFQLAKQRITTDSDTGAWYTRLKRDADKMLKEAPSRYELPDGVRLLPVSRKVLQRVETLALVYKLDGDQKYLQRLWLELEAVAVFQDWHPVHFLDTAEMTHAVAVAYDWLYEEWDEQQKQVLREAIVEKGLKPALALYRGEGTGGSWIYARHNWNFVCNGGIATGALALEDEFPDMAEEIIAKAVTSMTGAVVSYEPEGAWYEGGSYWRYGTGYLTYFLATAEQARGTDYGLGKWQGLRSTGYFPMYISGQGDYSFNFGDASAVRISSPALFWLAKKFNHPDFAAYRRDALRSGAKPQALDVLWYTPVPGSEKNETQLPRDKYYEKTELVTMRSAWGTPDGIFVGVKGFASDNRNHTDLDGGSFVLEADGVVWAEDLGPDNYNLPGYFDLKQGRRWQYYRKRAEGHNTLVINPGQMPDQNPQAQVLVKSFEKRPERAAAVLDMTAAYGAQAQAVTRTVALLDERTKVLVQDEVRLKAPGDIWWFMHTRASITVAPDGRSAILAREGKKLRAVIQSANPGLRFQVMPAMPLPQAPQPPGQDANHGIIKLVIHAAHEPAFSCGVEFSVYKE